MTSFLYPRTVTIKRPPAQPNAVGFQGEAPSSQRSSETVIVQNIPASIQLRGRQGNNPVGLPGDTDGSEWDVFIPKTAVQLGTLFENDVVVDDIGERYQVFGNYWNSLGYALRCLKQKA